MYECACTSSLEKYPSTTTLLVLVACSTFSLLSTSVDGGPVFFLTHATMVSLQDNNTHPTYIELAGLAHCTVYLQHPVERPFESLLSRVVRISQP